MPASKTAEELAVEARTAARGKEIVEVEARLLFDLSDRLEKADAVVGLARNMVTKGYNDKSMIWLAKAIESYEGPLT